ncbi:ferredoxin [Micromonospora sp. RP3T]|uniref:ferredoxin n=1 Tax=Micromonospora sp. RP3T TaxID=2135446 RepID=UPI000D16ABC5|nr:ferredoxin [Micromonospora sp. RP3T]PTA45211.1 ferredoxin [Micromonospora sp. RP3T]
MHVAADTEKCISSGHCAMAAPEVFDQDEETGIVRLRTDHPAAEHEAGVHDAAAVCPVLAITVSAERLG